MSKIPQQVRSAIDQIDPRPRRRLRAHLRCAAKWSPLAALAAAVGVFAWRYHTANNHFASQTDD